MLHRNARSLVLDETARKIVCAALHVLGMHLLLRSLLLLLRGVVQTRLRLLQLLRIERLVLHLEQMLPAHAQILHAPVADLPRCYLQPLDLLSQCFVQSVA